MFKLRIERLYSGTQSCRPPMVSRMATDPNEFAESVQKYHEAIKQEFDAIEAGDSDAILSAVRKKFAASALQLAEEVVSLARSAESEATKLSSIKFAFEFLFGKQDGKDSDFNEMLNKLTQTPDQ